MDLIKNLFMLQDCYNQISKYNSVLKDTKRLNDLKIIKEKFEKEKTECENYINSFKQLNKELLSLESTLNLNSKELDRLEYDLYNISGSDLKLIEAIESKKDAINKSNEELREKLSKNKNLEKELKSNIFKNRKHLEVLKGEFIKEKDNFSNSINEAKKKLPSKIKEKGELSKKIPASVLKNFESLLTNKNNAVSEFRDGICLGCKMMVSSMTLDEMKKGNELVYCDNCGRILYNKDRII